MNTVHHADPSLTTLDGIKGFIAGLVRAAERDRGGEVQLTFVGGEFSKAAGLPFDKHLTALATEGRVAVPSAKRKLVSFIEHFCHDVITLRQLPTGSYVVSAAASDSSRSAESVREEQRASFLFKKSVWAAFIRPLANESRRYLNLESIGFTDAETEPADGVWKEIPRTFILGLDRRAPVNGVHLQEKVEQWARDANVSMSLLVASLPKKPLTPAEAPVTVQKVEHARLETLLQIIEGLPDEALASWLIPAAVLKSLRKAELR